MYSVLCKSGNVYLTTNIFIVFVEIMHEFKIQEQ